MVLTPQQNMSGDPNFSQGFGRVVEGGAPAFHHEDVGSATDFFNENGFVVLADCLTNQELEHLNEFCDRTQRDRPDAWGLGERRRFYHRNQGLIFSQPLLDYPELDPFTRHPGSLPVVENILGGPEFVRFAEFNLRETPEHAGVGAMNFHHDRAMPDRLHRIPYMPCDWLCAVHYLSDVDQDAPAFCVVPRSGRFETLREAYDALGEDYQELPIRGPAGTCVLYDTAIYHTRFDGDGQRLRRSWHQYYGRGGWLKSTLPNGKVLQRAPSPSLTDWTLIPERLALHRDPEIRRFFSHWNSAQCEWVASGFDPGLRRSMPRGEH